MYLSKLLILNYRSCQNLQIQFNSNEPNVLIGINDSGKSSILRAAELLLSDKSTFNFIKDNSAKNDLSNTPLQIAEIEEAFARNALPLFPYDLKQSFILGQLFLEDGELNEEITETLSSQAKWALESNNGEFIWIAKVFDSNNSSTKSFVLLKDSLRNDFLISAYTQTNTQLTRLVADLNISPEFLSNDNNAGPLSIMEKIRGVYRQYPPTNIWHEFKFDKTDKTILPIFRYLDWNCSLEEIKTLAVDAMGGLIQEHLTPLRSRARETAQIVTQGINIRLEEIQAVIGADFPNITAIKTKVYIDLKESITDIVINKSNADGDIHLDAQGEGIKRQIWFAMIKAAAVTALEQGQTSNKFIWAFDEPETHLYPTAQRQLFEIIRNISSGNVQTIISTHSTIFIDKTKLSAIIGVIQGESGYTELYGIDDIDDIFEKLEIRNSDFLFFNKFLIIEGDTEAFLIPKLYKLWSGHSHEEDNVQIINIKGKDKWLEAKQILENIFKDFKKESNNLVFLFDNDASYKIGQQAITQNMFFVGTQDIEDSIGSDVWLNVCNKSLEPFNDTITIEEIEAIKAAIPNNRIANNNEKFYSKIQRYLKEKINQQQAERITYNLLPDKGSDSGEMILEFLTQPEMINEIIIQAFTNLNN